MSKSVAASPILLYFKLLQYCNHVALMLHTQSFFLTHFSRNMTDSTIQHKQNALFNFKTQRKQILFLFPLLSNSCCKESVHCIFNSFVCSSVREKTKQQKINRFISILFSSGLSSEPTSPISASLQVLLFSISDTQVSAIATVH